MPRISILVPVYNVENYIRPCLDSIMAQTFTDFEAVLVDDGSSDLSGSICDEYAAQDSRFVVVHKQNEGVSIARITAFEHSKGEYITFIDSDDYVDSHFLEIMYNTLKAHHADLVSCQYFLCQNGKKKSSMRSVYGYLDRIGIQKMIQSNYLYDIPTKCSSIPITLWTKLVHKRYVKDALNMGIGLKWGEDQITLFHILLHIDSLYVLDKSLYYYKVHQGQISNHYAQDLMSQSLEIYRRYQQLDTKGFLGQQLIIRTWLLSIKYSIFNVLPSAFVSYSSFIEELKRYQKLPLWKEFFRGYSTYIDWKNDLQYWILKLRLYSLFYFLYYRRALKNYRKNQ